MIHKQFQILSLLITLLLLSSSAYKSKHGALAIAPISKESIVKLAKGSSCFRFQVSQGDCYESKQWSDCKTFRERAELVDYQFAPLNNEVQYKFSFMLPLGYQELEVKQILGQWHNDVYGPTLSIRHLNGRIWLDLMLEKNQTTKKFFMNKLEHGVWYSFVLKVIWSKTKSGKIELWRNGKRVVTYSGRTLDLVLEHGPYFRFGLYRSHLYRITKPTWPTQSVFYCDISNSF